MNQQKYISYTADDFLDDPDFIASVKYPDQQKTEFWGRLIAEKSVDASTFRQAELQLQVILSASPVYPPAGFIDLLEQDIFDTIHRHDKIRVLQRRRTIAALAVAASLLIGIALSWFYTSTITVTTGYAQTQRVLLPDGTEVNLNAASAISYPRAMAYGRARRVRLRGEAFFDVTHLNHDTLHVRPSEIFVVETQKLHIEVLGTRFNVKERRGTTDVYLVKGKVRINGNHIRQILKPDELLSYQSPSSYHKITTAAYSHIAWLNHKMMVHNTSLKDVLENFEDVFGKKIILPDDSLYHKAIDGTIVMENEENTLFILSAITNCKVVKRNNQIYFIRAH